MLRDDGTVLFNLTFTSERSHNSQLFLPLQEALAVCGPSLDLIVVGTGPASYTGVRIGIAAAQGLAMSRRVPLIGLPSVLAPDTPDTPLEFGVCGDARRGSFFIAHVRDGRLHEGVTVTDATTFQERIAASFPEMPWYTFDPRPPLGLPGIRPVSPSAARLGLLASQLSLEERTTLSAAPLEPVYLAAAFITQPKPKPKATPV